MSRSILYNTGLPTGKLVYKDGTTFSLPKILVSSNGWVYKPDEIATPKSKTWPRGTGPQDARQWLETKWKQHIEGRNYEIPTRIESDYRGSGWREPMYDTLQASQWTEPWGWIHISLRFIKPTTMRVAIEVPVVAHTWVTRTFYDGPLSKDLITSGPEPYEGELPFPPTAGTFQSEAAKFVKDPYAYVEEHLPTLHLDTLQLDRYLLKGLNYTSLERPDTSTWPPIKPEGPDTYGASSGDGSLYLHGVIDGVLGDPATWENAERLFQVFRFAGYAIAPMYSYGADKNLVGIEIGIPKQGNVEAHSVVLKANYPHLIVDCGYEKNREKWMDHQKREAEVAMHALLTDMSNDEYTYEIGGQNDTTN